VSDYHRLRLKGFRRTELTFLGYDDDRFTPTPLEVDLAKHWANKLLFVGHYEKKTEAGIKALIKANLPVRVFGLGWQSAVRRKELKSNVEFRALTDSEYEWAIKAAEIGLCFVSHGNGNQTAGRSFEIPGSGTFLLAERTEQHMECYREGVEAEFFGDTQELVSKAQFYLDRARERREIAVNGQQKCKRHYSWKTLLKGDWAKVMELVRRCPDRS
jgi:glycosyltransferase involved in cell wall biosynthesis